MPTWTLTLRNGPHVERARFETLVQAIDALELRLDDLAPEARRKTIKALRREFDPVMQVAVRGEIAGPSRLLPTVRGGVDLRGDGSAEAYTGHWKRRLVELQAGESAFQALRRALVSAPA